MANTIPALDPSYLQNYGYQPYNPGLPTPSVGLDRYGDSAWPLGDVRYNFYTDPDGSFSGDGYHSEGPYYAAILFEAENAPFRLLKGATPQEVIATQNYYINGWVSYIINARPGFSPRANADTYATEAYALYLLSYVQWLAYSAALNSTIHSVIAYYNGVADTINNNPTVNNPAGAAAAAQKQVTDTVAYLQSLVNSYAATVTTAVNTTTTLVNSTVAQAGGTAAGAAASALATLTSALATVSGLEAQTQATVLAAVAGALAGAQAATKQYQDTATAAANSLVATLNSTSAALQAQAGQQAAGAAATVSAAQQQAMSTLAAAIVTANGELATAGALAQQQIAAALNVVLGAESGLVAQLADRPLYYGALTTPITIYNTTDVIVIPPGGLVITAD